MIDFMGACYNSKIQANKMTKKYLEEDFKEPINQLINAVNEVVKKENSRLPLTLFSFKKEIAKHIEREIDNIRI